ncbi:DUF1697 domain-containing protein [Nonomuraea antimicrobica]
MSTAFVVFYRNMNLGHPKSPDRATLEGALREAGAVSARSFQTNGTVLIEVGDAAPGEVVGRAAARLRTAGGYDDAAFVRPLDRLAAILDRAPSPAPVTSAPIARRSPSSTASRTSGPLFPGPTPGATSTSSRSPMAWR